MKRRAEADSRDVLVHLVKSASRLPMRPRVSESVMRHFSLRPRRRLLSSSRGSPACRTRHGGCRCTNHQSDVRKSTGIALVSARDLDRVQSPAFRYPIQDRACLAPVATSSRVRRYVCARCPTLRAVVPGRRRGPRTPPSRTSRPRRSNALPNCVYRFRSIRGMITAEGKRGHESGEGLRQL